MVYSLGDDIMENNKTSSFQVDHSREDGEWALIISVIPDIIYRESVLDSWDGNPACAGMTMG